ncbi:MAG: oligosaccharide flippase family protein [Chitinophagaceae bacterium]
MVFANVLVKPIWILLIDRTVQNRVGPEHYGTYNALLSLSIIFSILLDLGITNFNNREVAYDRKKIASLYSNILSIKFMLSIFYLLILIALAWLSDYNQQAFLLLFFVGLLQILNSYLQYLRSNVSAFHHFKLDSFLSVFDKIIVIILCSYFLFFYKNASFFSIQLFVYIQCIGYLTAILFALFITHKRYSTFAFQNIKWKDIKSITKKTIPYALLIFLMATYMRSDSYLLERIDSPYQNGIYAQAYRILDIFNMFGFLFAGVLLPMFSRMAMEKKMIANILKQSSFILLPFALAISAHSVFYAKDIMQLLYINTPNELFVIYKIVILTLPAFCLMHIYSTLLTATQHIKQLIHIALFCSLVSITLNFIWIPQWHAIGAAWVAFVVEWLAALLYIYFNLKLNGLQILISRIARLLFFFILFLILNYFLNHFLQIPLLYSIIANSIIFFIAVLLMKFWDKNDLFAFVNFKK